MTNTNTTVELDRASWRKVLKVIELGITDIEERELTNVAESRRALMENISEQVEAQYDEPETLDDQLHKLANSLDIELSLEVEETAMRVAHLRD